MSRYFEKISFDQFRSDVSDDKAMYENYSLPKRSTINSAGYDFESIVSFVLHKGETKKIPLGIKVIMNKDEMLMLVVRSSIGFKHNVRLCNQVGIIESDYYDNPTNEGHLFIKLQNEGNDDFVVNKGDRICQGIFVKFLTIDDEEEINSVRTGGIGSTERNEVNG